MVVGEDDWFSALARNFLGVEDSDSGLRNA